MNNTVNWAPVFDADRRPIEQASINDLKNVGAQIQSYGLAENDVLTFEEGTTVDNVGIVRQAPRNSGNRPSYLVACLINGQKTWINPMFFLRNKRENNRNSPIYPEWAALGDAEKVVEQLVKQGGIKAGKNFETTVAAFNSDGSAKMIPSIVATDGGQSTLVRAVEKRNFPKLPAPVNA